MLDQLVESKTNQKENRSGYLLTTFVLVVGLFFSALTWSLFAKDVGLGSGTLDVSTLVAPIVESAPVPIKKEQKHEQNNQPKSAEITRQANILRIDENPIVPKDVSVVPNLQKSRPNGNFTISPDNFESDGFTTNMTGRENVGGDTDDGIGTNPPPIENVKKPGVPPALKKLPVEIALKVKPTIKSEGVINGKAKFLPKPTYTAAAKAIRATGDVNVQVLIDEAGNVVSASAVGGHPLLKGEAEKAARNAKFNPTLLSGQPVKVSGVIVYKFSM